MHGSSIRYSLCDFFGDRVLDLEAGVDFDEVVFAVLVHQEFHGAGVLVAHLQDNTAQTLSLRANGAGNNAGNNAGLNTEAALAHLHEPRKTKPFLRLRKHKLLVTWKVSCIICADTSFSFNVIISLSQ